MEGDYLCTMGFPQCSHFNPLPPHGGRPILPGGWKAMNHFNPLPPHGGRHSRFHLYTCINEFQSTPSAWRETYFVSKMEKLNVFQSTPSAWRETPLGFHANAYSHISIHSLRMEGDYRLPRPCSWQLYFNPLPPHGGRRRIAA